MEPKEDFYRIQQEKENRGEENFRFPIAGEISKDWKKETTSVGELMERDNLQAYVSCPGDFTYDLYHQMGNSQAKEIAKHWDTVKQYISDNHRKRIDNIGENLAKLVIYNQEQGQDYPLFIIENDLLLPYTAGHIIDGNNRLISLLYSLSKGYIQESSPIPIWHAHFRTGLGLLYNTATFLLDKKPLKERISLIQERSRIH